MEENKELEQSKIDDSLIKEKDAIAIRQKIKELLDNKTDDKITNEDRVLLRQYEGVGGLKEDDVTVEGALSEFYTPTILVKKIWELMDAYHPDAYEVLEPTCGRGRFLDGRNDNHFTAYECDDTSARIAKLLFPNAEIHHDYFQSQFLSKSKRSLEKKLVEALEGVPVLPATNKDYKQYDLVIGNPPYGSANDKFKAFGLYGTTSTYPEFFIKEGLANLKVGGMLAFVVPTKLLKSLENSEILHYDQQPHSWSYLRGIMEENRFWGQILPNSTLIDAYRLPEGLFASTEIGTDILIFRKDAVHTNAEYSYLSNNYQKEKEETNRIYAKLKETSLFIINHPTHLLGEYKTRTSRHGREEIYVAMKDGETKEDVINKITPIPELIKQRTRAFIKEKITIDDVTGEIKEEQTTKKKKTNKKEVVLNLTESKLGKVMSENEFVEKYSLDKNFNEMDKEIWKNTRYDGTIDTVKLQDGTFDYLRNSSKYIRVADTILKTKDYTANIETYCLKSLYTTGNIYTKLERLEEDRKNGLVKNDRVYNKCKEALTEALPKKIELEDIHFSPLTEFAKKYTLERMQEVEVRKEISSSNGYSVYETSFENANRSISLINAFYMWALNTDEAIRSYEVRDKYNPALSRISPEDFKSERHLIGWADVVNYIEAVPIPKNITDRDRASADWPQIKKEKEMLALSKVQERRDISERIFDRFIHEGLTEKEQKELVDKYNKIFNAVVEPDYNTLPLYVDGMHSHKHIGNKDVEFTMHPCQLRGASFLSQKGTGLLAYDVGVGKTTTGIVATVMQIQLGRAKRPLIIVPKAVYNKWYEDIHAHFPNITINDLGNLDFAHSQKYLRGDHSLDIKDGTISLMTYNGFTDHISFMDESIEKNGILNDDLIEILAIKDTGTNREKSLELQKLNSRFGSCVKTKDERFAFWEKTGFDHITVDEAHNFKKLFTLPRTERGESNEYEGLSQAGTPSQRALKLYCASQLVQANNNGRNVFLLTATPFTNHPFEVFSMLSIMGRQRLKDLQINSIKDFANKFALTKSEWGINTAGDVDFVTSMKSWRGLKELQSLLHEYFDRVTAVDAGIKRPNKILFTPLLDITPLQKEIREAEEKVIVKGGGKGEVLKAIGNMRKSILSPALLTEPMRYPSTTIIPPLNEMVECSPKIRLTLDTIAKVYKEYPQGGQVVYCNLKDGLGAMRDYLVSKGIPKRSIAIFTGGGDSNSDGGNENSELDKKQAKMMHFNDPNHPLKIILGTSTIKEGVDLNGNTVALYNLTLDWNPTDITQVEGRAWRQGNKQQNVNIIYPLTYNSVDAFMYQKYDEKSSRINELWSYKGSSLEIQEINPMEMKYNLITEPEKRAKLIIDDKVKTLELTIKGYEQEKEKYHSIISSFDFEPIYKDEIENAKQQIEEKKQAGEYYSYFKSIIKTNEKQLKNFEKAKANLNVYSKQDAQSKIDIINHRIQNKQKEIEAVKADKENILEEVRKEIEATLPPKKTVDEYVEELSSSILSTITRNIDNTEQIENSSNLTPPQTQSNDNINSVQKDEKQTINSPVSPTLDNKEMPLFSSSSSAPSTSTAQTTSNENNNDTKEKSLTKDEAVKRYGITFTKKEQKQGIPREQLFFAFLIAKDNEMYEGHKETAHILYNRLKNANVPIELVSDKAVEIIENSLKEKYGDEFKGNHIYGYEENGKIYISESRINLNALVHEYTHLWCNSVMLSNPELWERIKSNVIKTDTFKEMYNDPRYNDISDNLDRLSSEVLCRLSSANNVTLLEQKISNLLIKNDNRVKCTEEALSSLYGWTETNVFKGYKHTLDLSEITTRILGDALLSQKEINIKETYTPEHLIKGTFNKDEALKQGYTRLKDILLNQYFSLRPNMRDNLKNHITEHFESLSKTDAKTACEILSRKVEEEALSYRFFKSIQDKEYSDVTFQMHVNNCFNENTKDDFMSAINSGYKIEKYAGYSDTERGNFSLHFTNFVILDYFKNDNKITGQLIKEFIEKEGKQAVRFLYIIAGDNMDYKLKIRSLLPEKEIIDTETNRPIKQTETFGIVDYETNKILSSKYDTTYLTSPTENIKSDLTLDERAITLSDEFIAAFGNTHRYEELKALKKEQNLTDREIDLIEWKEKNYITSKNEVDKKVINAIVNGYTISSLYQSEEYQKSFQKQVDENKKAFESVKKEIEDEKEHKQNLDELFFSVKKDFDKQNLKITNSQNHKIGDSLILDNDNNLSNTTSNEIDEMYKEYLDSLVVVNEKDESVSLRTVEVQMTEEEWQIKKEQMQKEREEAEKERQEERKQSVIKANKYYAWNSGRQVPNLKYLQEHGITGDEAHISGVHYNPKFHSLQIPLYSNETNTLVNLQTIRADERNEYGKWSKYFLKGSDTNVHATIGGKTNDIIFLTEGWATGMAVYKATGSRVYCSMSSGNLSKTADFIQKEHPDAFIVCIADNDSKIETPEIKGVGQIEAEKTCANLVITIPTPKQDASDYALTNDLRGFIKEKMLNANEYRDYVMKQREREERQRDNELSLSVM